MKKSNILIDLLISLTVFVLTTTVSFWVWSRYLEDVDAEHKETINTLGEHTSSRVWSTMNTDIDQLKNFTNQVLIPQTI